MTELTLEMAEQAVRAAQARARALGSPMTVTVVDEGAAAAFRKSTTELGEQANKGSAFWRAAPVVLQGQALPTPGGSPIMKNGRCIGGIGCGGGTGEQDQECSDAGAAAVK